MNKVNTGIESGNNRVNAGKIQVRAIRYQVLPIYKGNIPDSITRFIIPDLFKGKYIKVYIGRGMGIVASNSLSGTKLNN